MKSNSHLLRFIIVFCALLACCGLAPAATVVWTGADSAVTTNWSDGLNWVGNTPPSAADIAFFSTNGASAAAGAAFADNTVNANSTVAVLTYADTNAIHNTVINPGVTLTISNTTVAAVLLSGTMTDAGDPVALVNTVSGAGGALAINDTNVGSALIVQQASATQGDGHTTHVSTLDLSGLDTFNATAGRVLVAVQGQLNPVAGQVIIPDIFYPEGTFLLAKTNLIQMTQLGVILGGQDGGNGAGQGGAASLSGPAIVVGDASSVQATAIMQLGQTNAVFADTICVGRLKSAGTLSFNTAFTSPTLYLRGASSNRVPMFLVADDSHLSTSTTGASACTGTVDLSGGTSDLMIDTLFIASGQQGNGTAPVTGALTLGAGVMDVNTIQIGYQNSAAADAVTQGTLNVNASSSLVVNNQIVLGRSLGGPVIPTGKLNINSGAVTVANGILDQSGSASSTIMLVNGSLTAGTVGTPAAPLGSLTIGDSILNLAVSSQASPVVTTSLTTSSTTNNTINVTTISPIAGLEPKITLIQSATAIQGNMDFVLGTLPAGYAGTLQTNSGGTEVQLVLSSSPFVANNWTGADVSNHNTNWSDGLNWSTSAAPGASSPAFFLNNGSVSSSALSAPGGGPGALIPSHINNLVDSNFTILALTYANTNGTYQNTFVSNNATLNLTLGGLTVGSPDTDFGSTTGSVTITGGGGVLSVNNSNSVIFVGLGDSSMASTAKATLDLSGLGTFNATVSSLLVGVGGYSSGSASILQSVGTVYLAQTNVLLASSPSSGANDFTPVAIEVGDAGDAETLAGYNNGISSALYLGQTNAIFADYVTVGRQWGSGAIFFNPAFAGSTAYFRGAGGGPMVSWNIGDGVQNTLTMGGGSGTNDFTGGTIDALVNTMNIARSSPNSTTGTSAVNGTLTFNAGTIAASAINVSYNPAASDASGNVYDYGVGTINVKGTGILVVTNTLNLGVTLGTPVGGQPTATLNVNGGAVLANRIVPGPSGTVSTIALNGGALTISNAVGSPAAPLTLLNLTNATISLGVSGSAGISVGNLNVDGLSSPSNTFNILSLPAIEQYPLTFTLIQSANPIILGGGVFNFKVGSLPAGSPNFTAAITESADHTAALLTVLSGPVSVRGNVFWNGPDGANMNWSDGANWLLPPVPGVLDTAFFSNVGLAGGPGGANVNNIVDANIIVAGLTYGETNASSFHNTVINSGVTLTVSNTANSAVLLSGSQTDLGAPIPIAYNTISGAGGTLVVKDTNVGSAILVQQCSGGSGTESHLSTLDLSGLDIFKATVGRLLVGVQGFTNTTGQAAIPNITRPAGMLLLAKTNLISLTQLGSIVGPYDAANGTGAGSASIAGPALCVGDAFGTPAGNDIIQLGQTNAIFADTITIGREKPIGTLSFNPSFTTPTLYLRGASQNRVALFYVADDSHVATSTTGGSGTVDLSGGASDLMVDLLGIGQGERGNGSAGITATFTLGAGTLNANTVYVGQLATNTAAGNVIGTLNVNAGGNLVVNNQLVLAQWLSGGSAVKTRPTGALNIGGAVSAASIVSGGGATNSITITNGTLSLTSVAGSIGSIAVPIGRITLTNATLNLAIGGFPPVVTTNLIVAGSANAISVTSLPPIPSVPATNTIIQSISAINGAYNFTLASLPAGYAGTLSTNAAYTAIQLVITAAPFPPTGPTITSVSLQFGTNVVITGTNGLAGSGFYVLSSTNVALPVTSWTPVATNSFNGSGNFSVTLPFSPSDSQRLYRIKSQ